MHHLVAFEPIPPVVSNAGATFTLIRRNGTGRHFMTYFMNPIM